MYGIDQLARQNHNQMITDARQRQLRRQAPRSTSGRSLAGAGITRRLSAAIAKAGMAAAHASGAIRASQAG
jgi:hypothetical protein